MTVSSVTKGWSRQGSSFGSDDGLTYFARFTEMYQIIHDASDTNEALIHDGAVALGMPDYQQRPPYPGTGIPLVRTTLNKVGPVFTMAILEYEGEAGPNGPGDSPENKLPEVDWSDVPWSTPVDECLDDELGGGAGPIVTVNDEPLVGATAELSDQQVSITRNFLAIDVAVLQAYRVATNSDPVIVSTGPGITTTFAPGTARLMGYSARLNYSATGTTFWTVTARIQFRYRYKNTSDATAWWSRIRHEGLLVKDDVGDIVHARDEHQQLVTQPVLLDSDGKQITDTTQAYWREFKLYESLPYANLGIL